MAAPAPALHTQLSDETTVMKPYSTIPIQDCGEPLVPLDPERLVLPRPHAYEVLGAPYGERSPYFLRQGVSDRLLQAQTQLQITHPGWAIQVFDAYRPIAVQQFMVDTVFAEQIQTQGLNAATLSPAQREALLAQVYQFWAPPSPDPRTPPPHSTGAAVDVTLVDAEGQPVDMGSPIDELSVRSYPDHFAPLPGEMAGEMEGDPAHASYHTHRCLLRTAMQAAGFRQHPQEWWHFSWGDQLWAWLERQSGANPEAIAHYGRAEDPYSAGVSPPQ
jgi:D-alanyl-D-alanine dipeptidase